MLLQHRHMHQCSKALLVAHRFSMQSRQLLPRPAGAVPTAMP